MQVLQSELSIIKELNKGSVAAFDALYYQYHKAVFANIFKLVKKQEDAEDILQEVFTTLWLKRTQIHADKQLGAWLVVVSYNLSINFLNKQIKAVLQTKQTGFEEIADYPVADEPQLFEQQLQIINEAIEQLPLRKKQAFTLCKLQGKSYEEAAGILGISSYTVKEHLSAAIKYIKEYATTQHSSQAAWSIIMLFCMH